MYNSDMVQRVTTDPLHTSTEKFVALDVDAGDVVVAICTPLMKRVHRYIKHSGEMVFVDASGSMDRHGMRVFLLMTHSPAGGLPIGVLITTNERCATIIRALTLYNSMLDNTAYFNRGRTGPVVFMTDDSAAERSALQAVYPEALLLLCIFHVLQAFWRFLWDAHSAVPKNDRPYVFNAVKKLVYATDQPTLMTLYGEVMCDDQISAHPKVLQHVEGLFERRSEWAICCRSDLPIRANNTNNYVERAMRVLKDNILHRTKAFNVPQLLDFVVCRFEQFYQRRLQDVASNRLQQSANSKFVLTSSSIDCTRIKNISDAEYEVPSETLADVSYTINMFLGSCTCPQGYTGGPCKHQYAVMTTYHRRSCNFLPVRDPSIRQLLYAIATGNSVVPSTWFQSLVPKADIPQADSSAVHDSCHALPSHNDTDSMEEDQATDSNSQPMELHADEEACSSAKDAVFERIDAVMGRIKTMYAEDPASFRPAMLAFCTAAERMTTPAAMQSALHCFGKYSGAATAFSAKRKNFAGMKRIGVQPTALARRKMPIGGRKRTHLGRPAKARWAVEHGYCNQSQERGLNRQVWPKRSAPHSMTAVVSNIESLGRTHSAK